MFELSWDSARCDSKSRLVNTIFVKQIMVEELAESIKHYGLLQPIVIRPVSPSYEVVAGNRRLAAAKLLKLRKLSCQKIYEKKSH